MPGATSLPSLFMYVDMNSFFASCEQQDEPTLRGQPIGVVPFLSPTACVIAPSIEAKKFGVRTGMRINECLALCPHLIPVAARPWRYRQFHVSIMSVLHSFCNELVARSIDEAFLNLTSYRLVYKDAHALAKDIKEAIKKECGQYILCSIGIAPNVFLAKLGTELQKPDGLIEITPQNLEYYLSKLKLQDLPGIGSRNAQRLQRVGIHNPVELHRASASILRSAFGGIVGNYWHARLHFREVDIYQNPYKAMSAGRTISRAQRSQPEQLQGLFIALCSRLEQRMVKQEIFCRTVHLTAKYINNIKWEATARTSYPVQDSMELREYLLDKVRQYEKQTGTKVFNEQLVHLGVEVKDFINASDVSYTLFDNKMKQDNLRKVLYNIKDRFGRDIVRKASETIAPGVMTDAIGFGSVRDMYAATPEHSENPQDHLVNKYLLEA